MTPAIQPTEQPQPETRQKMQRNPAPPPLSATATKPDDPAPLFISSPIAAPPPPSKSHRENLYCRPCFYTNNSSNTTISTGKLTEKFHSNPHCEPPLATPIYNPKTTRNRSHHGCYQRPFLYSIFTMKPSFFNLQQQQTMETTTIQKGVVIIHHQVRKISQEMRKIKYPSLQQHQIWPKNMKLKELNLILKWKEVKKWLKGQHLKMEEHPAFRTLFQLLLMLVP